MARVDPPALAAQPLAVEQVGAGELGPQRRAAEPLDRLGVAALRRLARRSAALASAPRGPAPSRSPRRSSSPTAAAARRPRASASPLRDGGLDQLGERTCRAKGAYVSSAACSAAANASRVVPETVVEDRCRPVGDLEAESLPAGDRVVGVRGDERLPLPPAAPGRRRAAGRRTRPSGLPVTSLTASSSAPSDVAVSKSPHKMATTRVGVQCGGQRGQRARGAGDLEVPGAQHDPAVEVPERDGRYLSEKAPLQPVVGGHLIAEERVARPAAESALPRRARR